MKIIFLAFIILLVSSSICSAGSLSSFQVQPAQIPSIIDYIAQQINAAEKTVDMVVYDFASDTIYDAITTACQQGVTFQIYADFDQNGEDNSLINQLVESFPSQVQVLWDSWKVHSKFLIIDNKQLIIVSSSWTDDEDSSTIDFLFTSNDASLLNKAWTSFHYVFPNKWKADPPSPQDDDDSKRATSLKAKTQFLFERGVQNEYITLIKAAKTTIEGAMYKLTDQTFYDALQMATKRGVKIDLYLDGDENDVDDSLSNMVSLISLLSLEFYSSLEPYHLS